MIHVLDPSRTDPNGHPERAEPTGKWYLLDGEMWIEMDYGYIPQAKYDIEEYQFLGMKRTRQVASQLECKPVSRRFFNENDIIEVNI